MAIHVTVVSPSEKNSGALFDIDEIPTRSYVDGTSSSTELEFAFCASTVMLDGIINSGLVVSTTLTNCSALVVFPDVSVTVHVTVVSPSGKNSGALFDTISIDTESNVSGIPILTIFLSNDSASVLISDGDAITGRIVSETITCWVILDEFPDSSVAVHVTVVSPSGKNSGALFDIDEIPTRSMASALSRVTLFSYFDTASTIICSIS